MLNARWGNFLGGFLTVAVKGKYPEKLMNLALARGIFLWDVKRTPEGICFRIRNSAYQALQNLTEEHGFELEVINTEGFPFYRQVLQRRRMLMWGAGLFVLALYLLSSFIWVIEVNGNVNLSTETILKAAARHGLYEGAMKWNLAKTDVEDGILKDLLQLSYVEVNIKGVKAQIKVVEKVLPNQPEGPCHIVARKDGIIESVLVLKGQALVKEGETVAKGDVLISGIVFPETRLDGEDGQGVMHPQIVTAQGQVKARVWYEGYGECGLTTQKSVFTGRSAERIVLVTPWARYTLRECGEKFNQSVRNQKSYTLQSPWGKWGWVTTVSREKETITLSHSPDEALDKARGQALERLKRKLGSGGKVVDTDMKTLSCPADSVVRVKAYAEVVEEIGVPQPINLEANAR